MSTSSVHWHICCCSKYARHAQLWCAYGFRMFLIRIVKYLSCIWTSTKYSVLASCDYWRFLCHCIELAMCLHQLHVCFEMCQEWRTQFFLVLCIPGLSIRSVSIGLLVKLFRGSKIIRYEAVLYVTWVLWSKNCKMPELSLKSYICLHVYRVLNWISTALISRR